MESRGSRIFAIDALRGIVMVIMALDHVRDFFHSAAMSSSPTDLSKTTAVLFFTRWITHFCLPVFMFTAGMGAYLWMHGRHSKAQLSQFLLTRGVWFILLELTVMQFAYNFNFPFRYLFLLLVLWIFGICMIALAGLIYLPPRWLLTVTIAVIAMHNCLDTIDAKRFGSGVWAWEIFHQPGVFTVLGHTVLVTYPLIPWMAVMAAGFCFGEVFTWDSLSRQRLMLRLGISITVAFFIVRAINLYGDPAPWSVQKSAVFTVLSFLNCTKYPASLDFLLMTLGPAILVLRYLDQRSFQTNNPLMVFGRVPLFYFVLHFYAIHLLTIVMAFFRYGNAAFSFIFNPVPSMGGPEKLFPAEFGYPLWVVYIVWLALVGALYPLCRWFANVKARNRSWWLSYL